MKRKEFVVKINFQVKEKKIYCSVKFKSMSVIMNTANYLRCSLVALSSEDASSTSSSAAATASAVSASASSSSASLLGPGLGTVLEPLEVGLYQLSWPPGSAGLGHGRATYSSTSLEVASSKLGLAGCLGPWVTMMPEWCTARSLFPGCS